MKGNTLAMLKCLMWTICAFHVLVGAGLNLVPEVSKFMASMYGAEVTWTAEFTYILKPLGAFMFALGLLAAAAAWNPCKYRLVMYAFAALFIIRAIQRIVWADEIYETFAITAGRNYGNVAFFLLLAAAVIVLDVLANKQPDSAAPAAS